MRILGIDPGLNTTGYGVIEVADRQVRLVEAGVVRGKTRGSLARVRMRLGSHPVWSLVTFSRSPRLFEPHGCAT